MLPKQSRWPVPFSGTIYVRDATHQDEMNTYLSLTLTSTCAKVFPLLLFHYICDRKEIQANFLAKNNKQYKQDNPTTHKPLKKIKALALHKSRSMSSASRGKTTTKMISSQSFEILSSVFIQLP